MIKRRFYRVDHADRDDAVDSSSSSDSDSELEGQATEASEDDAVVEVKENDESCSTSSDEDDGEIGNERQLSVENQIYRRCGANEKKSNIITPQKESVTDFPDCILQIKSVFRCRICPRVLCLTEETMRTHLNSKRHGQSEKLLKEHRLKAILNDDGEIENQETASEIHARVVALAQDKPQKKDKRRQRKRHPSRKAIVDKNLAKKIAKQLTHSPTKKSRKSDI